MYSCLVPSSASEDGMTSGPWGAFGSWGVSTVIVTSGGAGMGFGSVTRGTVSVSSSSVAGFTFPMGFCGSAGMDSPAAGAAERVGRVKTRSAAASFSSRRLSDRSRRLAAPCRAACAPAFAPCVTGAAARRPPSTAWSNKCSKRMSVAQTTAPSVKTNKRMWLDTSPTIRRRPADTAAPTSPPPPARSANGAALVVWARCHQAIPMTNSIPAPPAKFVRVWCARPQMCMTPMAVRKNGNSHAPIPTSARKPRTRASPSSPARSPMTRLTSRIRPRATRVRPQMS